MQGKIEIKAVIFRQFRFMCVKLFDRENREVAAFSCEFLCEVLLKSVVHKRVLRYYIPWFNDLVLKISDYS